VLFVGGLADADDDLATPSVHLTVDAQNVALVAVVPLVERPVQADSRLDGEDGSTEGDLVHAAVRRVSVQVRRNDRIHVHPFHGSVRPLSFLPIVDDGLVRSANDAVGVNRVIGRLGDPQEAGTRLAFRAL
jgi:hypothetical protein